MNFSLHRAAFMLPLLMVQALGAVDFEIARLHNLELTVRSFPRKAVYGDPLYLELRVINRGNSIVHAPRFSEGNIVFRATDEEFGVGLDCSLVRVGYADFAELPIVEYSPGESRRFFFHIFLPKIHQLTHPYWTGIEHRGGVRIHCGFTAGRLTLMSDETWADIAPRDPAQLEVLRRWSRLDSSRKNETDTKIFPFTVGIIGLQDVRTRENTKQVAAAVTSGELGELLRLTLRLQDLEASTDRAAGSQALVEWVKHLPNIKRQWTAGRLSKLDWLMSRSAIQDLKDLAQ